MILLNALAVIIATPATVNADIARATAVDTVSLGDADYAGIVIKNRATPVTISAKGARVQFVEVMGGSGCVTWNGGAIVGANPLGYGFRISESCAKISKTAFSGMARGVVFDRATGAVVDSYFDDFTIDAVDIGLSKFVDVLRNTVVHAPVSKSHPDCIQAYSRPGYVTSDVRIEDNVCIGKLQGVFLGNSPVGPQRIEAGGFDRMVVRNNTIRNLYPQGVSAFSCRDCDITGNKVSSLPGAEFKSNMTITGSTGKFCGNVVTDVPKAPAAKACP